MIALIIFIGLIVGLNCIPLLTKTNFPKVEKVIVRILSASTFLFLSYTIFEFNGFRLKGLYTFPTIGLTFIISTLIYFVLFKNTIKKILTVFLLTPLIVLSIFTLLFGRVVKEFRINDNYKIVVTAGGLLSCGEHIKMTESIFGILDKEIYHKSNLCLKGISNIETIAFDDKQAEFLIYHNAEMDSENPYRLKIENKNVW